jgi:hypothetical protein
MTGTLTLTAGTLTLVSPAALGWGTTVNGTDQQLPDPTAADQSYLANDATGSGAGWHVTVGATQFTTGTATLANTGTFSTNGSITSSTDITAPSAACVAATTCTVPTNTTAYPVAITTAATAPTPVTVYDTSATSGLGQVNIGATAGSAPVGWWLSVPSNVLAGAYTSTVTVTLLSAP